MREGTVRGVGLSLVAGYAAFIGWLYAGQPQTIAEVTGGLSTSVGLHRIDSHAFEEGLTIFRQDGAFTQEALHPASGYLAFFTLLLFVGGLALLPSRESRPFAGLTERVRSQVAGPDFQDFSVDPAGHPGDRALP